MKKICFGLIIMVLLFSCDKGIIPKPKPYLKLQYPLSTYKLTQTNCPYNFEISTSAKFTVKSNCWAAIEYPELKATIYITYREVDHNLDEILREVEKLTFEHTVKADIINAIPYENLETRVFGNLYNIEGNVATNIQFRATDSVKHVLSGALYFYAKPNYDSIVPTIKYLEKDMKHLIETLEWE